jgi:hypothetical protein
VTTSLIVVAVLSKRDASIDRHKQRTRIRISNIQDSLAFYWRVENGYCTTYAGRSYLILRFFLSFLIPRSCYCLCGSGHVS